MAIKRLTAEEIEAKSRGSEIPDEAYAYVDKDFRLLKHHTKFVKDADDDWSVDPELLEQCIVLANETLPFSEETLMNVLAHLYLHKEHLSASKGERNPDKKVKENKRKQRVSAEILINLIAALIPGDDLAKEDAVAAEASVIDRETSDNGIVWHLDIHTDGNDKVYSVPIKMSYSADGNLVSAMIYGSKIPGDLIGEVEKFISKVQELV